MNACDPHEKAQLLVAREPDGKPVTRRHKGRDRNRLCPCGSGRKVKRCFCGSDPRASR